MKSRKKRPYRGPLTLTWCDECNVPIAAGKYCGICNSETRRVPIAPPGDVRPAFKGDRQLILDSIGVHFGIEVAKQLIPKNKILLLNSIPDIDKCDEVILDGRILGLHRFSLEHLSWTFVPKLEGARRLARLTSAKKVVIDPSAVEFIARGANVLRPGIASADPSIQIGEPVIVVTKSDQVVLTGPAMMTGKEMLNRERGMAIRKRYFGDPESPLILRAGQNWKQVLKANDPLLQRLIAKASDFIHTVMAEYNLPLVVAFSGGKDSLAVLLLVRQAISDQEFSTMFIDTGIEFPETLENIKQVVSQYNLQNRFLVKHVNPEQFFRVLNEFGFVARDYRVCCKTVKLGPTTQLIEENFPEGCLSFIGQRRYESPQRSRKDKVWHNPWVPNQIGASPIHDWTALMIWLYLFKEKAPFNKLYRQGFDRIGCMFCPASTMNEFQLIADHYPDAWQKWLSTAERIVKQQGFSQDWLKFGFWRWKNHPPKIKELAELLKIPLERSTELDQSDHLTYSLSKPVKTSRDESSIHGRFNQPIDLNLASAFFPVLGESIKDNQRNLVQLTFDTKMGVCHALLFHSGNFTVSGSKKMVEKATRELIKAVYRGLLCTNCGTCKTLCPNDAIISKAERVEINSERCTQCGECLRGKCPTLYAVSSNK
jgi:phosphoadenosine phosphosulfate reductase